MCYYNGQKVTRAEYIRLKQLEKLVADYKFLDNELIDGFSYGKIAVLKKSGTKENPDFDIVTMEWGFIPSWHKSYEQVVAMRKGGTNESGKYQPPIITLNAIGEEILEKPMYKKSAREKRCLILSSGFYEWRHIFPINKKTGKPLKTAIKYPYYITLRNQPYFFMAGIYNNWTDSNTGENIDSCAIVTTEANALMQEVHNSKKRMPLILDEEDAYNWLFDDLTDEKIIEITHKKYPAEKMYAYPIHKDFLSANRTPTERFEYPDLPPINLPEYLEEYSKIQKNTPTTEQGSLFG